MSNIITTNGSNINTAGGNITCSGITIELLSTTNLIPPLDVKGYTSAYNAGTYNYFSSSSGINIGQASTAGRNISIKAEKSIWCDDHFLATSDVRIKENIIDLKDSNPFETLNQLEPVRYTFKDKVSKGQLEEYGFIAQKVKLLLPHAVSIHKEYVPNIMDCAKIYISESKYFIQLETKSTKIIEIQDDVTKFKTYVSMKDGSYPEIIFTLVEIVDDKTFEVVPENDKHNILDVSGLFVYGQFVNDFHLLDKSFIIPLNTACIQELYKTTSNQSSHIEELKTTVASQQSQIDFLTQQLADLKALVQTLLPNP